MQILIIIGCVLFPILNVLGLLCVIYYVKNNEIKDKKLANEELNNLLNKLKLYTDIDNNGIIKWRLNEIGKGIEDIAIKLYKED